MATRVDENDIQTNEDAGTPDNTKTVQRVVEPITTGSTGTRVTYSTGDNNGEIPGNSSRDITVPLNTDEANLVNIKLVPGSSTEASLQIFEDVSRDQIDLVFEATQITDTDSLNTIPPGVQGTPYIEKQGQEQLNVTINNNTSTASNFELEVKLV